MQNITLLRVWRCNTKHSNHDAVQSIHIYLLLVFKNMKRYNFVLNGTQLFFFLIPAFIELLPTIVQAKFYWPTPRNALFYRWSITVIDHLYSPLVTLENEKCFNSTKLVKPRAFSVRPKSDVAIGLSSLLFILIQR